MMEEPNSIDPELLRSLRDDARVPVSRGARERVSARLLASGVGAAAGVASVTEVAGASSNGGASTVVANGALVKSVFVGVVLAAGAGVAAYAARGTFAHEPPRPGELAPPRGPDHTTVERRVSPAPAPQPVPLPTTTLEQVEQVQQRIAPVRPKGSDAAIRLAEQQALLDEARSALRGGEAGRALESLARHRAKFPQTAFDEERRALEIRALVASGSVKQARERLESFERRFGQSLQRPFLQRAVAQAERNVTDPEHSAESSQHEDKAR